MALFRIAGLILFSLAVFSLPGCISADTGGEQAVNRNCIRHYNITRATSPWQGFTSSYEEEEASKTIQALDLERSGYSPLSSLAGYSRNGIVLIGRNEKLRRVAVNAEYFSLLNRADATRPAAQRFFIGVCSKKMRREFAPAVIAEFLVESHIVNTYWHVESLFCLDAEDDTADLYKAHYSGKHIYFTDSKNEDPHDFSIIIDKKTGEMFVEVK